MKKIVVREIDLNLAKFPCSMYSTHMWASGRLVITEPGKDDVHLFDLCTSCIETLIYDLSLVTLPNPDEQEAYQEYKDQQ